MHSQRCKCCVCCLCRFVFLFFPLHFSYSFNNSMCLHLHFCQSQFVCFFSLQRVSSEWTLLKHSATETRLLDVRAVCWCKVNRPTQSDWKNFVIFAFSIAPINGNEYSRAVCKHKKNAFTCQISRRKRISDRLWKQFSLTGMKQAHLNGTA